MINTSYPVITKNSCNIFINFRLAWNLNNILEENSLNAYTDIINLSELSNNSTLVYIHKQSKLIYKLLFLSKDYYGTYYSTDIEVLVNTVNHVQYKVLDRDEHTPLETASNEIYMVADTVSITGINYAVLQDQNLYCVLNIDYLLEHDADHCIDLFEHNVWYPYKSVPKYTILEGPLKGSQETIQIPINNSTLAEDSDNVKISIVNNLLSIDFKPEETDEDTEATTYIKSINGVPIQTDKLYVADIRSDQVIVKNNLNEADPKTEEGFILFEDLFRLPVGANKWLPDEPSAENPENME